MAIANLQVASGNDDGREPGSGTPVLDGATEIIMVVEGASAWAAMRFTNVPIPQGSTINSATLSIYVHSATYDSPDINIFLDDADNSAALTTGLNDFSGRALTTASVVWTATNIGTGWKSPGAMTAVVQEVVNRAGWASGNAMTVLFDARTGANELRWRPYEFGSSLQTKLDIDYTPPGGALSKVVSIRLATKVGNGLTR